MLSNIYINNLMQFIEGFEGVFSSDNAPLLSKKNSSIIVNFDKKDQPGSHFVAYYFNNEEKCLYFDSTNSDIIPEEIQNYHALYKNLEDHSTEIQSFESTYCGFYCMLFIICNTISPMYWCNIINVFKKHNFKNDNKCISLLIKTVKYYFKKKK